MSHNDNPLGPSAFRYRSGYSRWEAYGISSNRPFLTGGALATGDELKVEFPSITRNVVVMSSGSGGAIRIHFDSKDNPNVYAQHRYISLSDAAADPEGGRIDMPVRCKEIYISNDSGQAGSFQLIGYCAPVEKNDVGAMSGSGINTN